MKMRERMRFRKPRYEECSDELHNPGCGWYNVHTFWADPGAGTGGVQWHAWQDDGMDIALVVICLGGFQDRPISDGALANIQSILELFHDAGKQVVLRFTYDTEGKALMKEPRSLARVKEHIGQAAGAIRPYLDGILVLQGAFTGNWGEMHDSRHLYDSGLCELASAVYAATDRRCFLAVRTPSQWRILERCLGRTEKIMEKMGLFNDGMFGSETDLGTYVMPPGGKDSWEKWTRKKELEWQDGHVGHVPNGGEALAGVPMAGYAQASEDMAKMHVSYLNACYHPDQLAYWKSETVPGRGCWAGLSGYDYIGRHLGYRFVVRKARLKHGMLQVTVENCGFANLCEEADCWLTIDKGGVQQPRHKISTDARGWESGGATVLEVPLEPGMCGTAYLELVRRRDGRPIRFANQGAGGRVPIGELSPVDVPFLCRART